jgi:hypothetical protein
MRRGSGTIAERASLLGGALLLALAGCSKEVGAASTEDGEPQAQEQAGEDQSGFLRPAELPRQDPSAIPAEPSDAGVEEAAPADPPAEPPSEAEPQPEPEPGPGYDDAADEELAVALLHADQAAFDQLVDRRRERLPEARRRLLLAFAAARAAAGEQAAALAEGLDDEEAVRPGELALLRQALDPSAPRAVPASLSVATPLERAMQMVVLEREAAAHIERGEFPGASRALSQLLLAEIASPWEADRGALARWSEQLHAAQERYRWSRLGDWPAIDVTVQPGDHLIGIRKRVLAESPEELLLCTGLIAKANGLVNEESIQPDDVLRIPTDRASALVDVSARWAFYLLGGEVVAAWEVGVGKEQGSTRPGTYTITLKQREPMWFQAGKDPVPFGDPQNPLGTRWLEWGLDGKGTSLGFHGTSDPSGVGGRVSQGCVRMRNGDVELLYDILPLGAEVVVQP